MKPNITIEPELLSMERFWPFGHYANLISPSGISIGEEPIRFYRDMLQLPSSIGNGSLSFSICRVEPRPMQIDINEFHSYTGEGILPLDNDVLIHVAAATPEAPIPQSFRAFHVPKGTMVVIRPGVWHHAPFVLNGNAANVLVVLPERTYANDCHSVKLAPQESINISV